MKNFQSSLNMKYAELNTENFNIASLDGFKRHQEVYECWRKEGENYILKPVRYTEDWSLEELREMAQKIITVTDCGGMACGAFCGEDVVGFALLPKGKFGSRNQYIDLAEFYVSAPYRSRGIGRKLFEQICGYAKNSGAEKIYISAHSAKESIAAYKSFGCVLAEEINEELANAEPCDVQMEFVL